MRKGILVLIMILVFASTSFAGFNFGTTTYEQVDNILIVNSLGDQTIESQFVHDGKNLGYNDFIPENAFKNDLYNQGYSVVYDYDNSSLDLVEVGYMGLKGDPRTYDADYVLREEYKKYSSQYQDVRIDKNKTNISNNTSLINTVDTKQTKWNKRQDKKINKNKSNIVTNKTNIKTNKKSINVNKKNIKINKNNIKTNKTNIKVNKKEIKNVDRKHTNWNNKQDRKINTNKSGIKTNKKIIKRNTSNITNNANNISSNSNRINDLDTRVNKLEQTQVNIVGELILVQGRKHKISTYGKYNTNRNVCSEVGVKFTFSFGDSWETKEILKNQNRLKLLEEKLNSSEYQEALENVQIKKYDVIVNDSIIRIDTRF